MARVELPTEPPSPRRTRASFLRFSPTHRPEGIPSPIEAGSAHLTADASSTGLGCGTWGVSSWSHPPTQLTPHPGHNFQSESPPGFLPASYLAPMLTTNMHYRPSVYLQNTSITKRRTKTDFIAGTLSVRPCRPRLSESCIRILHWPSRSIDTSPLLSATTHRDSNSSVLRKLRCSGDCRILKKSAKPTLQRTSEPDRLAGFSYSLHLPTA